MRRLIVVVLSLTIQAAALTAPLVHAHVDQQDTDHHHARTIHAHWADHDQFHHASDQPAIASDDHDDAVFLNTFVAVAAASFPMLAPLPGAFELPVPPERHAHRSVRIVHTHDPPDSRPLSSRAPPACLS